MEYTKTVAISSKPTRANIVVVNSPAAPYSHITSAVAAGAVKIARVPNKMANKGSPVNR